jgi:hypothetical protein
LQTQSDQSPGLMRHSPGHSGIAFDGQGLKPLPTF